MKAGFPYGAIMGEAQILRQRLIEHAEGVWEVHASVDGDGAPAADPPGRAGEVAEAVDRDDDCFGERRNMEGGGKVGEMMLDPVHLAAKAGKLAASSSRTLRRARRFLIRLRTSAKLGRWDTR
jgi:hypothetical protein